uniref:Uncharacterized protein n=1 Tax=Caenorhabditis japonica TaxID=281687 RepID=A0A8R1EAH7_CAEJA
MTYSKKPTTRSTRHTAELPFTSSGSSCMTLFRTLFTMAPPTVSFVLDTYSVKRQPERNRHRSVKYIIGDRNL